MSVRSADDEVPRGSARAVESEDYETAARLRDQIKTAEGAEK